MRFLCFVMFLGWFEVDGTQDAQSTGCTMDNAITLDCDDLGLTSIPTGIMESILTIKLKSNMIHNGGGRLTAASVLAGRMHGGLEELQLNGNGIFEIDANTFAGFASLLVLKLAGNKLTEATPGMFTGLDRLGELWLNNMNTLTELKAGAFAAFTDSLYLLNLKTTGLRILENGSLNAIVIPAKSEAGGPFVVDTRDAISLCATSPMNEIKCICDVGLVGEDDGYCEVPTTSTVSTEESTTSSSVTTSAAGTTTGNVASTEVEPAADSTGTSAPDTTPGDRATISAPEPGEQRETTFASTTMLVNPSPVIPGSSQEKLSTSESNAAAQGKAGKGKKGKGKKGKGKGKKGNDGSQSGLTISFNREIDGKVHKKSKKKHAKSVLEKEGVSSLKGDVDVTSRIPFVSGVALLAMCGTILVGAAFSRRWQEQRATGKYSAVSGLEREPKEKLPQKKFLSVAGIRKDKVSGRVVHF